MSQDSLDFEMSLFFLVYLYDVSLHLITLYKQEEKLLK